MDDAVTAAFGAVPREAFLPRDAQWRAAHDGPIPIGRGQTNSQPRTVEAMLRLLDVRPGQRVLDVGAGSGWTTALLAHLVGPTGEVLGVELEPDLVAWGSANLEHVGSTGTIRTADPARLGAGDDAPWDRILVSAEAVRLPQALVDQLADPGRMVVPVSGWMTLVTKDDGRVATSRHGAYRFVPLR